MIRNKDIAYFTMGYNNVVNKAIEDMGEQELNTRLIKFKLLLEILYHSELLNISKISISRGHINKKDIDLNFDCPSNPDLVYSDICDVIKSVPNTGIIRLEGLTTLEVENNIKKEFDECLNMYYSIRDESLEVNIISDPWVPRDLEGNLQIDLAELNAPRLYNCFEEIIQKFN